MSVIVKQEDIGRYQQHQCHCETSCSVAVQAGVQCIHHNHHVGTLGTWLMHANGLQL